MDIARRELGRSTIPIVVGAPKLARYSFFGTLFARHNVDGTVHRIDRHPTMSVHPTTPMREADMRRHIGAQTSQQIALLAAPAVSGPDAAAALDAALDAEPDALLIDIVDSDAEGKVGTLLGRMAERHAPLFVLGSSGVEYALVAAWRAEGRLPAEPPQMQAHAVDRLFVISGSCSPATGAQIAAAIRGGFRDVALDPLKLIEEGDQGPMPVPRSSGSPKRSMRVATSWPIVRPARATREKPWSRTISNSAGFQRRRDASRAVVRSRLRRVVCSRAC